MDEITPAEAPVTKKPTRRFQDWLKSEAAVRFGELGVGGVAIVILFWRLQYSTSAICCGDFDGYYHMKWARLLWENIKAKHFFPPTFTWLPLTTLNSNDYVDHHLLYHILLIPFTWFRDVQTGGKIAAILFASIALFSCYWLIVRYEVRYRLLWLLALLASSAPFLYRMNMTKAPPLASNDGTRCNIRDTASSPISEKLATTTNTLPAPSQRWNAMTLPPSLLWKTWWPALARKAA